MRRLIHRQEVIRTGRQSRCELRRLTTLWAAAIASQPTNAGVSLPTAATGTRSLDGEGRKRPRPSMTSKTTQPTTAPTTGRDDQGRSQLRRVGANPGDHQETHTAPAEGQPPGRGLLATPAVTGAQDGGAAEPAKRELPLVDPDRRQQPARPGKDCAISISTIMYYGPNRRRPSAKRRRRPGLPGRL